MDTITYLTLESTEAHVVDYFEVCRSSSTTFLVPMTTSRSREFPDIFVPGCKYKIKARAPNGLNLLMRLYGDNGKTDWLDNKALDSSLYQGDMLTLIFTGTDVGKVTKFELRNDGGESDTTISKIEVQKCTCTSRSQNQSQYYWSEIYVFNNTVNLNASQNNIMNLSQSPIYKSALQERSLNTIIESDDDQFIIAGDAAIVHGAVFDETMEDVQEYEVVLGYDINDIWNGAFELMLHGTDNHCKVQFGDHKMISTGNITNNKTVMQHSFEHDYLGPLKYIVINQSKQKITSWPFEYIWAKHSEHNGQVRYSINSKSSFCFHFITEQN